jgi:hypothetical protein
LHGAWVGDAFHLVTVFNPDPWRPEKQLRVMRADADGVSSHLDLLTGLLDQPRIVLGSADLRLTYHALDANASVVKLTRFGPAGQVLQDAVVPPTTVINSTPAVAMGEDTVVLLGAEKTLALTRLGPDGRMIGTPVQIVQGVSVGGVDVQRLGSDVVVSWFSYVSGRRRLGLARVAP